MGFELVVSDGSPVGLRRLFGEKMRWKNNRVLASSENAPTRVVAVGKWVFSWISGEFEEAVW